MTDREQYQDDQTDGFKPSTPDLSGLVQDNDSSEVTTEQPTNPAEGTPFANLFARAQRADAPPQLLPTIHQEPVTNTSLEEKQDLLRDMRRRADIERENVPAARLEIRIDKAGILAILDELEQLFPPPRESSINPERYQREHQEKLISLRKTLEAIASLPEIIHFEPGLTIIVGENGIGKSTLAKAIKYAAEVEDRARELPFSISDIDDPIEPKGREEAIKRVLEPNKISPDDTTELFRAGLAPMIAKHLYVTELAHSAPGYRYYDPTEVMGEVAMYAREAGRGYTGYTSDGFDLSRDAEYSRDGRSHRQTVDERLFSTIKRDQEMAKRYPQRDREFARNDYSGPQVMFIDEPETGMSPRRHRNLANELIEISPDGSVLIVPSNSIVLYESDTPRIDLEHPEWGIFRPSEHPGYFTE